MWRSCCSIFTLDVDVYFISARPCRALVSPPMNYKSVTRVRVPVIEWRETSLERLSECRDKRQTALTGVA